MAYKFCFEESLPVHCWMNEWMNRFMIFMCTEWSFPIPFDGNDKDDDDGNDNIIAYIFLLCHLVRQRARPIRRNAPRLLAPALLLRIHVVHSSDIECQLLDRIGYFVIQILFINYWLVYIPEAGSAWKNVVRRVTRNSCPGNLDYVLGTFTTNFTVETDS